MTKDAALKLALEALEISVSCTDMYYVPTGKSMIPEVEGAIAAIKEALAEPEKEPVAWMAYTQEGQSAFVTDNPAQIHPSQRALPLYATPQWVGLTNQEIDQICGDVGYGYIDVARAIEAKLKEKNT